jgi:large subunit ribosomal protein L10
MNRDQKAAVIDEVAAQIEGADAIFAVDYRGLSVRQAADLRSRLIEVGANMRVVKNTLTERAADKAGIGDLKQYLDGPTAFTFVTGDVVLAAKALAGFRRETQKPEFKGGWMDGRELTIEQIESLSRLPSLEVMHGQLVGLIAMPISGLARGLNALLSGIAIALGQIQEKGLVGGDAPAPEAEEAPSAEETPAADAEAPAADEGTAAGEEGESESSAEPAAETTETSETTEEDSTEEPSASADDSSDSE